MLQKCCLNIVFMLMTLPYDSNSFVRAVRLPRNWNNHKQLPLSTFLHEICSSKLMQPTICRKTNVLTVLSDGAISVGCKRKHMVNVDYFQQRFDTGFRMVIGSEISSTSVGSKADCDQWRTFPNNRTQLSALLHFLVEIVMKKARLTCFRRNFKFIKTL